MRLAAIVLFGISLCCHLTQAQNYLSPQHIVHNQKTSKAFVSLSTATQIAICDTECDSVIDVITLPDDPGGLACDDTGEWLYVTGVTGNRVYKVSVPDRKVVASVATGHGPQGIALSKQSQRLWVANRYSNDVSVVDIPTFTELARLPVIREPVDVAIAPDGRLAAVANFLPNDSMQQKVVSARLTLFRTLGLSVVKHIPMPNGATALSDLCFSPDGRFVYLTHILARYQLPTFQLERGWMTTNAVSIVDAVKGEYINTVLLDDIDRGAANPCGLAIALDGKSLFVVLAGTHELCVLDLDKLHDALDRLSAGQNISSAADVSMDLSFAADIKKRFPLRGRGPRFVTVMQDKLYISDYFSAGLDIFDLNNHRAGKFLSLGAEPEKTDERQGEFDFHDATRCFQTWLSCASCHPGGGRVDGLSWDLLNDGVGNAKNTKNLLLAHVTPPAMITGIRADAETAVRAGIRHIQFAVRPERDARQIDAYLKSLRPVPSPHLKDGRLSKGAVRGKVLFHKTGCTDCHNGSWYSNGEKYQVGTGTGRHAETAFDTPTLIELWRTAPYLYDGRAATLDEVFTVYNRKDRHGKTSNLLPQELQDLILYISSL